MNKINNFFPALFIFLIGFSFFYFTGCGGDTNAGNPDNFSNVKKSTAPGMTAFEEENGFGPVKEKLNLAPVNMNLAKDGEKIFESKCATCHKLDERYVGPAQRNVLQRVTLEFFVNMVLNPDENLKKHPHAKKMLAEYMQMMTNQNVNMNDALALLEYFRALNEELEKTSKK